MTPYFPPEVNGVSLVVEKHALGFVKRGHQVTIVTSLLNSQAPRNVLGINIIEFPVKGGPLPNNFYKGSLVKYILYIRRSVKEYDVVFFHCWQIWSTDLLIFQRKKKIDARIIMVSHCSPRVNFSSFLESFRSLILMAYRRIFLPILIRKFDDIVFLSDKASGDIQWDYRYTLEKYKEKVHIIPNGMDNFIDHIGPNIGINVNQKRKFLYVANYDRIKNQKLALEVFIEVNKMVKNVSLVFVGSVENRISNELKFIISRNNLSDRVEVLSGLSRSEIQYLYSKSFVTLFTSKTECLPMSVLESIYHKKPVISTNVGSIEQIPGVVICKTKEELICKAQLMLGNEEYYNNKVRDISIQSHKFMWHCILDRYEEMIMNKPNSKSCQ